MIRRGDSADNSFYALASVRSLSVMAERLGKKKDAEEFDQLASHIENSINKRLWVEAGGHYGMRITPEGELDVRPCSPGLMRPLWLNIMSPEDDRAASSVECVLNHLMIAPGYIRTIPTEFYPIPGNYPAYLLMDLCKLDHPYAEQALYDLMLFICPSGLCGEYYDFETLRSRVSMHRARIWETGLNAEAVLYFLTGFEPDAYAKKICFKPRIPKGWDGFNITNMHIGGSQVSIRASLSDREQKYILLLSGEERFAVTFTLLLPEQWDDVEVAVNGRNTPCIFKTGRYGIRKCDLRFDMNGNEKIEIVMAVK